VVFEGRLCHRVLFSWRPSEVCEVSTRCLMAPRDRLVVGVTTRRPGSRQASPHTRPNRLVS
jgi:hypothetical protein